MVYVTVSTFLVGLFGVFTTLYTQRIIVIIFMIMSYNEQLTRLPNIKNRK